MSIVPQSWKEALLKSKFRLKEEYEFRRVKKYGQRVGGPFFLVNYLRVKRKYSRFGFITTKLLGNAVIRNRVKRLLREGIRLKMKQVLVGYDIVILARPGIVGKAFNEVGNELERLFEKAGLFKKK